MVIIKASETGRRRKSSNLTFCVLISAAFSLVTPLTAFRVEPTTVLLMRGGSTAVEIDEEDIDYKARDDWWKDPLAAFDDPSPPKKTPPKKSSKKKKNEKAVTDSPKAVMEDLLIIAEEPQKKSEKKVKSEKKSSNKKEEPVLMNELLVFGAEESVKKEKKTNKAWGKKSNEKKEKENSKKNKGGLFSKTADLKKNVFGASKTSPRKSGGGGASPFALVAPMVPKLKALALAHPGASKILGLVALGAGVTNTLRRSEKIPEKEVSDSYEEDEEHDALDLDQVLREERELERRLDPVELSDSNDPDPPATETASKGFFGIGSKKEDTTSSPGPTLTPPSRMPNKRKLWDQVQELHGKLQAAESSKAKVDSEYEKASLDLQKATSEVKSLKTTTTYLQSQLSENEELLRRTVQNERRKAQDELLRLKNSMVEVVERERQAMRAEFLKQASELETMMWSKKEQTPSTSQGRATKSAGPERKRSRAAATSSSRPPQRGPRKEPTRSSRNDSRSRREYEARRSPSRSGGEKRTSRRRPQQTRASA